MNLFRRRTSERGMTVTEALVAFAVIGLTVIAMMELTQVVLRSRQRIDRSLRRWNEIQAAVSPGGPCPAPIQEEDRRIAVSSAPPYAWALWTDAAVPFPCVPAADSP